jgi:hypothetical protein
MPLVSLLFNLGYAFAQATRAGTVVGTASDPQGAVIAGVTVTLSDVTLKSSRTVPTNAAGGYVFVNVPARDVFSQSLDAWFHDHKER